MTDIQDRPQSTHEQLLSTAAYHSHSRQSDHCGCARRFPGIVAPPRARVNTGNQGRHRALARISWWLTTDASRLLRSAETRASGACPGAGVTAAAGHSQLQAQDNEDFFLSVKKSNYMFENSSG
jgi:hypothetical protein